MTRLEDMSAQELREELDDWTARCLMYAKELLAASESNDLAWEHGIKVALRQALDHVRRLERLLHLGVAA